MNKKIVRAIEIKRDTALARALSTPHKLQVAKKKAVKKKKGGA